MHAEYNEGEQPCPEFKPHEAEREYWSGFARHECPVCLGLRMFCGACFTDHHAGGWGPCWEIQRKKEDGGE